MAGGVLKWAKKYELTGSYALDAGATSQYASHHGGFITTGTDTHNPVPMLRAGRAFKASITVTSTTNALTITLQRNSADTALVISVPGGGAGTYFDNGAVVQYGVGDTLQWKIVSATANAYTLTSLVLWLEEGG